MREVVGSSPTVSTIAKNHYICVLSTVLTQYIVVIFILYAFYTQNLNSDVKIWGNFRPKMQLFVRFRLVACDHKY